MISDDLHIEVGQQQLVTRDAVREPSLFKLASGDLLLSFHIQPDVHFAHRKCLRLRKGETTWEPEPQRAHREQAMGQAKDGIVIAPDIYTFERQPGQYIGSFFRSDDGGNTFTGPHESVLHMDRVKATRCPTEAHFPPEDHPQRHFYQALPEYHESIAQNASPMQGPIFWRYLLEKDGRWLATMQCQWHGDRSKRTTLVESFNAGKIWRYVSTIAYEHHSPGDGICEPVMLRLNDDSLLCVLRRGAKLPMGQTRSTDDGKTWSPIELLQGHGVDPDLCLMSENILACTYGRPGRFIMFSTDGTGKQWSYHTPIGDWKGSSYMSIAQIAPDKLLLVYDYSEGSRDPALCYIGSTILTVKRKA